ncbi:coiled-coil protein [Mycolicibacterium canariasense]|uniref:Coiled-coil protein n=1 Tax=Mycolicibacterium canariasense TaxID=228230 RepID=A0A100WCM2_MYCCR|nr:hypothetical protein [Mycolicibacterium canariasense]MCV7212626.1 hypothetical protein [Mycolicibacterium canariasense]ORV02533.1 hypothetical protein AWB94_00920 [Mycolicibacterium canariasense]GAS95513.1 coiled-coil protein [Mycolicibacterium canariasense]
MSDALSTAGAFRRLDELQSEHAVLLRDFAVVDQENMALRAQVEELTVENDALKAAAAARDSVLATAVAKACNGRQI